jgi:hypothetical protein
MVEVGAMISLIKMLSEAEAELTVSLLCAIHKLLECDSEKNELGNHFEELNGLKIVESLQMHENIEVYKAAVQILIDFYELTEVQ